jgi:alkaline phosphatase
MKAINAMKFRFAAVVLMMLMLAAPAFAGQKHVFLVIGDGMGLEQIGLMETYNSNVYDKKSNITHSLMGKATMAVVKTGSADSPVTDSAAAATAIATGHKTNRNMLGILPDGKKVETVLEAAKKNGYATALITTDMVVGATPAGFAAHVKSRKEYDAIAEQLISAGVDYIIGGGKMHFAPEKTDEKGKKHAGRKDGKDLLKEAKDKGYTVVTKMEDFEQLQKAGKLLALFSDKEINFSIADRDPVAQPSLKEMTDKFIELAEKEGKPFFVMIEGARIDHASHNNDAASTLEEMRDLDDAVGSVLSFYEKNSGNTAVIVTSDHVTGGIALTCYKDADKTVCPKYDDLQAFKRVPFSFDKAVKTIDVTFKGIKSGNPSMSDEDAYKKAVEQLIEEHMVGLHIPDSDIKMLLSKKAWAEPYQYKAQQAIIGKAYFRMLFTSWASAYHTHSPVLSMSVGSGTEEIKGYIDNTDLAKALFKLVK